MPQCRFCLEDADEDQLIAPCNCDGSHKFVHQECLAEWRRGRFPGARRRCNVCNAKWTTKPPPRAEREFFARAVKTAPRYRPAARDVAHAAALRALLQAAGGLIAQAPRRAEAEAEALQGDDAILTWATDANAAAARAREAAEAPAPAPAPSVEDAAAGWAAVTELIDARMQEAILHHRYCAELANQMRESIKDVAAEYVCPLTLELPVDPVMAKDGRIYERSHILAWLSRNATSPVTREPMGTELTPVPIIRNSIEKLVSSGAIEGDIAEAWQKASAKKRADEMLVKETRAKAEGGEGDAMYLLGAWYQLGMNGLAKDKAQARAWYERSAAARDPRGLATFGSCLLVGELGDGGPQDNALGLVNVTEAAHLGSDLGAYLLGRGFFAGDWGLPEDHRRARYWLKKVFDGECEFKHLCHEDRSDAEEILDALESAGE